MEENQNNQNQMPNNQGFNPYNSQNNNQGGNPNYAPNMNQNPNMNPNPNMNQNFNANPNQTIKETKGFFSGFFKDPIGKIKDLASNFDKNYIKFGIILMIVWVAISFISHILAIADDALFGFWGSFSNFFDELFDDIFAIIKSIITPVISVALLSGLIYLFNQKKNKSFLAISTGVLLAKVPVILYTVLSLTTLISYRVLGFLSCISALCTVISAVLLFFVVKEFLNEGENKSFFWKFALIMLIYYGVAFILSLLEISII